MEALFQLKPIQLDRNSNQALKTRKDKTNTEKNVQKHASLVSKAGWFIRSIVYRYRSRCGEDIVPARQKKVYIYEYKVLQ